MHSQCAHYVQSDAARGGILMSHLAQLSLESIGPKQAYVSHNTRTPHLPLVIPRPSSLHVAHSPWNHNTHTHNRSVTLVGPVSHTDGYQAVSLALTTRCTF